MISEDEYEMLRMSPTGMICSSSIKWTDLDGSVTKTETKGHYTVRGARKDCLRSAIRMGWTYPRWWQWWRWDDTRPDLDFS